MLDTIITYVATLLGASPAAAVGFLGLVYALASFTAAIIPDDAVGTLGMIRKVARVLSLSVPNRATS